MRVWSRYFPHRDLLPAPANESAFLSRDDRPAGRARLALRLDRRRRDRRRVRAAAHRRDARRRHAGAVRRAPSAGALARHRVDSVLHGAHGAADVHRIRRVAAVHARLGLRRGEESPRADRHAAHDRHPPVGAGAGVPVDHGDRVHRPLSGKPAGRRVREHLRDLHRAGVEHDVRVLSLDDHGAGGSAGGRDRVPAQSLAALLQRGAALVVDRARLELDDELRRRLVLRRAERGDHRPQQEHQAAGAGRVHGDRGRAGRHARGAVRDRGDDRDDRRDRPAVLAAARRVGREIQVRADRRGRGSDVVGARSAAPLLPRRARSRRASRQCSRAHRGAHRWPLPTPRTGWSGRVPH